MTSLNKDGGIKIDVELKAFFVIGSYALLKFLDTKIQKFTLILMARSFFVIGHVFFAAIFLKTRLHIGQFLVSQEAKAEYVKSIRSIFFGLLAKAAVVTLIHLRTQMLPPLIISCFMGLFSLMENRFYLDILCKSSGFFQKLKEM